MAEVKQSPKVLAIFQWNSGIFPCIKRQAKSGTKVKNSEIFVDLFAQMRKNEFDSAMPFGCCASFQFSKALKNIELPASLAGRGNKQEVGMFISQLLEGKKKLITITEGVSIGEACETLAVNNIGAVLVLSGDGGIAGILSERDIVRILNSIGADVLNAKVGDHMTSSVVTCKESDTVDDVMGKMTAGRFRHIPVVREKELIGIISIGDVVKHKIALAEQEAEQIKSYITMS